MKLTSFSLLSLCLAGTAGGCVTVAFNCLMSRDLVSTALMLLPAAVTLGFAFLFNEASHEDYAFTKWYEGISKPTKRPDNDLSWEKDLEELKREPPGDGAEEDGV